MLSQEVEERLAEHLVNRIEEVNTFILKKIGENIKYISTLSPSEAYKLGQILKYGGSYNEIAKELARVSGKNVQDIYKIFEEVAKSNKQFAKDFYKYRNMDFIPYSQDYALQSQVKAIATMTADTYRNIANTSIIGFTENGEFKQLGEMYRNVIDKAILSVTQGKQDYYSAMRDTLKELGGSGLVQYESGNTRRLDSAVRMNLLDGMRQLNNEMSKRFGEEYGADGVEISVHAYPAPDHADIQGRQFSNEEFEKLENGEVATGYNGIHYDGADKRQISQYNCYHKVFAIVLGVSKPEYTDEELLNILRQNADGFEFEGKHYTMYEGTQLQRQLELAARKQKDTQILAKSAGDMELVDECQKKLTQINYKYNELNKASGLKPKKSRMIVSGYQRTKISNVAKPQIDLDEEFYMLSRDLEAKNIDVDNSIFQIPDKKLRNAQLKQLNELSTKYNHNTNDKHELDLLVSNLGENSYAKAFYKPKAIKLNKKYFENKEELISNSKSDMESGWHYKIPDDKISVSTITHEYGHILEYQYFEMIKQSRIRRNMRYSYKEIDKDLRDTIMANAMNKLTEKISITEFKKKYWSKYAISKRNSEWFAETFEKYMLSDEKDAWTEAFGEWLEGYFNE